jgi:hypothetical protein
MDLFMLIKNYKLLSIIHLEKMNNYLANDFPSMNNIYDSTYYTKTKNYEQGLSDEYYKKAQMPFKSGVIPHYLTGDDYNV